MKNDFFMYAQQEAMAVGGLGAFAIWLDAELLQVRLCCMLCLLLTALVTVFKLAPLFATLRTLAALHPDHSHDDQAAQLTVTLHLHRNHRTGSTDPHCDKCCINVHQSISHWLEPFSEGVLLHMLRLQGSSGSCGTFGSPCLASKEEFKVAAVELWGLL
jgi:hypothetical protein